MERKSMMEQEDFIFFVFEPCERCGKDVAPREHIDLDGGVAMVLCRDCLEYLSSNGAEFDEYIQKLRSSKIIL